MKVRTTSDSRRPWCLPPTDTPTSSCKLWNTTPRRAGSLRIASSSMGRGGSQWKCATWRTSQRNTRRCLILECRSTGTQVSSNCVNSRSNEKYYPINTNKIILWNKQTPQIPRSLLKIFILNPTSSPFISGSRRSTSFSRSKNKPSPRRSTRRNPFSTITQSKPLRRKANCWKNQKGWS